MPETCVIKSGEIILLDDPRLNDPGCSIEPGVVIRPPIDESAVEEQVKDAPKPVKKKQVAVKSEPAKVVEEVEAPPPLTKPLEVTKKVATTTQVVIPSKPAPQSNDSLDISPEAIMIATTAAVVLAGTAAATSAAGGFSALQAKISSLFGSKATVATAAAVTAGTIVAVKALEAKMNNLEKDMKKAKEDVAGAASSIDRIDELLSRLGDDNDDKLDPSV